MFALISSGLFIISYCNLLRQELFSNWLHGNLDEFHIKIQEYRKDLFY